MRHGWAVLPLLATVWSGAGAQSSLATRMRAAGTRTVAISTRARPEACGDGLTYLRDGLSLGATLESYGQYMQGEGWTPPPCLHGPLRVTLRVVDGAPSRLQASVGPLAPLPDTVLDLGNIAATEAGAYLGDLARAGEGHLSEQALLPLLLVDSTPRWEMLAAAARDSTRFQRYRQRASSLLARGAINTLGAAAWADDPAAEQRRAAVSALATRRARDPDPVPDLLAIARVNPHPDARAAALRQLGHTADPRAIDLFASMLGVR